MSGGADSVLAACRAKEQYPNADLYGIFIDYGQVAAQAEETTAQKVVERLGLVNLKVVTVRNLYNGGVNSVPDDKEGVDGKLSAVYTPLRNVALMGITAAHAAVIGADMIVTGNKGIEQIEGDPYSFKDSTRKFHELSEILINATLEEGGIRVNQILSNTLAKKMTKKDVYAELLGYGFRYDATFSCFYPVDGKECGECHNCIEKKLIFKELNNE